MNFTVFSILLWHEGAVQMFDWFCTLSLFILASKSDEPGWQKQPKTQHNIKTNSFSKPREREACSSFNIITITKCTFDPFLVRFNIVESPWKKLFPIITYIITTGNRCFLTSLFSLSLDLIRHKNAALQSTEFHPKMLKEALLHQQLQLHTFKNISVYVELQLYNSVLL